MTGDVWPRCGAAERLSCCYDEDSEGMQMASPPCVSSGGGSAYTGTQTCGNRWYSDGAWSFHLPPGHSPSAEKRKDRH